MAWKHRTLSYDEGAGVVICSFCGPVPVAWNYRANGVRRPRCSVAARQQKGTTEPHGLTREESAQFKAGRECEVCGSRERLCVDHDHATGRIRGVLCWICNFMIGLARDNPETLRRGAEYLDRH